jgi:hypothetical protein
MTDDQAQKPSGSFLCKTHGWHIEFHCPACPKPDASPRETYTLGDAFAVTITLFKECQAER